MPLRDRRAAVQIKTSNREANCMLQFENTNQIKNALLRMVKEHGETILDDEKRFLSLMNDYIPEYEKERRLFKHVLSNGILSMLRREDNQRIAILKA